MTTQTAQFLLVIIGIAMAGAGIIALLIIFGHIGKTYDVVIDRDKTRAVVAILLALLGLVLIGMALFLPTVSARAADGPPSWGSKAQVSTCAPYNPASCQARTVWVEKRLCGMRGKWWHPQDGLQVVSIRCGQ
jgi:tellurite resistance protein TehA-like permease